VDCGGTRFEMDPRVTAQRLRQEFSVSPSWSNSKALSALGNARLTLPVYKRLSFTVGAIDTFLNDLPPGFKRNSFQATAGLTYGLR